CLDQQTVSVSVITTFELHQLRPSGDATCETNRRHRRFGAAAYHAYHLDRRHCIDHFLRELDFEFGRCAKAGSLGCDFLNSSDDFFIRVAQNHRSPRTDIVDVSISIDVGDGRATRRADKSWRASNAAKSAHRRIDTPGYEILRHSKQLLGSSFH